MDRSVGWPVGNEVLAECPAPALHAPTPANRQAWRWLVVRDQEAAFITPHPDGELFTPAGTGPAAADLDPIRYRPGASS